MNKLSFNNTQVGSVISNNDTLKELILNGDANGSIKELSLDDSSLNTKIKLVLLEETTKGFIHPVFNKSSLGTEVYVDVRDVINLKQYLKDGEIKVKNQHIFNLKVELAAMVSLWESGNNAKLLTLAPDLGKIYAAVMSAAVSQKLSLTNETSSILRTLFVLYWYDMVSDDKNEMSRSLYLNKRSLSSSSVNTKILKNTKPMKSLPDLVDVIKENTESGILANMSAGDLLNSVSNIWHGYNAIEFNALALEYPPYFIAIAHTVITNTFYKNTSIGREVYRNKDALKEYNVYIRRELEMHNDLYVVDKIK